MEGALCYMATTASAPVFLSYNTDDGTFYPYQAQLMDAKLTSLSVPHQVVTGIGGHHVTTNFTTLSAIYDFFKAQAHTLPNKPGKTVLSNYDTNANLLDLKIDANGNGSSVMYAIYTGATQRNWVQANGTLGTNPIWRALSDWGSPVRVGPLVNLHTARFTVVAYDPSRFTTAQNNENALPPISGISIDSSTGEISFTWPAPTGVTNANDLTVTVQRSTTLGNDWIVVPGATITITTETVTFRDPAPPAGEAFYRVAQP
jgi:hypothetical protein